MEYTTALTGFYATCTPSPEPTLTASNLTHLLNLTVYCVSILPS